MAAFKSLLFQDADMLARGYNLTESQLSGLASERVLVLRRV